MRVPPRVAQYAPKFHPSGLDPPSPPPPRSMGRVVVGAGADDESGMGAAATVDALKTRQSTVARRVRVEANMVCGLCGVRWRFYKAGRSTHRDGGEEGGGGTYGLGYRRYENECEKYEGFLKRFFPGRTRG